MERTIEADVVVLTEAKMPKDGVPLGMTAVCTSGGIGEKRKWGKDRAHDECHLATRSNLMREAELPLTNKGVRSEI